MEEKVKENKIEKFIVDNDLDFSETGSGFNGVCCIISGYALHLGYNILDLYEELERAGIEVTDEVELDRVFDFAEKNAYGVWWESKEAKDQYTF